MLVVAQDTTHAEALRQIIEADDFFGGRYKGRVIRVDSATQGEESDEATARLLALEHDDQTDVVIHVNKLKEGWDVRNLYTIVPLARFRFGYSDRADIGPWPSASLRNPDGR